MNEIVTKVIRAFQPGDTVFVELDRPATMQQMENVRRDMREIIKASGINIIVLDYGMRIAGREELLQRDGAPLPPTTRDGVRGG